MPWGPPGANVCLRHYWWHVYSQGGCSTTGDSTTPLLHTDIVYLYFLTGVNQKYVIVSQHLTQTHRAALTAQPHYFKHSLSLSKDYISSTQGTKCLPRILSRKSSFCICGQLKKKPSTRLSRVKVKQQLAKKSN